MPAARFFTPEAGADRREHLFLSCLAGSVILHAVILFMPWPQRASLPQSVEIDLTIPSVPGPGIGGMRGPGKTPNIPLGVPEAPKPAPAPKKAMAPAPPPYKSWDVDKPVAHKLPQAAAPAEQPRPLAPSHAAAPSAIEGPAASGVSSPVSGSATGSKAPGLGMPFGKGSGLPGGGGGPIIIPPRLLNAEDVLAALRRYYPENERQRGKEGTVDLYLHIGADGLIHKIDIAQTAGPYFDAAAEKVARLMRFSPAENAAGPVPVKIAQPFVFKLTD